MAIYRASTMPSHPINPKLTLSIRLATLCAITQACAMAHRVAKRVQMVNLLDSRLAFQSEWHFGME